MDDLTALIGGALVLGVRGSDPDSPDLREDLELCAQARIGGVILFDRDLATGGSRNIESPAQVRELTQALRESLGRDLLIMVDQEGGKVARLREQHGFDSGIAANEFARLNAAAQRDVAAAQARQLAALGINVNLAPVVDLSISNASQVIGGLGRSFSVDPQEVARCARIWIEEHRKQGVATCLKHFPGHGSASGDTHQGLVDITGRQPAEAELAPYRALADEPGAMVMTGHLLDRAIDPMRPASLSTAHTAGTLRRDIGFDGVVITDSIDMGAITEQWSAGEAAALAIDAGADLALDGVNAPGQPRACPALALVEAVRDAIESGRMRDGRDKLELSRRRIAALHQQLRIP